MVYELVSGIEMGWETAWRREAQAPPALQNLSDY